MTKPTPLKSKLTQRKPTIGSWLSLASDETCEIMAQGRFEWLGIDMEHTAIGVNDMARLIRIAELSGIAPIVRVGANDPLLIKRALDAGAHGIIVPMVCTAADAEAAVAAAHYPPRGTRGVGLHRAQDYGGGFAEYREWAERELVVIAQIEHKDGVENLDAIMSTPGIDAFFVGPYDLSASFGAPGDFANPDVVAAIDKIDASVRSGPIPGGIHVVEPDPENLRQRIAAGHCLIAYGVDMIFLTGAVDAARQTVTSALEDTQ